MSYTGWAIVELMGHRVRAGEVSEEEAYGTRLLRVDRPVPDGGEPVTEYYGGAAIYALRPCSEEVARRYAVQLGDPRPARAPMLLHYADPMREPDDDLPHVAEDVMVDADPGYF